MIEVHFLGVGAALPAPGQSNCAYLLKAAGAAVLIDCGPAILQQLAAAGLTPGDVTDVFVSHRHGDHTLGYPMFLLWHKLEGRPGAEPPTVVASTITWPSLRALWEHSYGELEPGTVRTVELPADRPAEHILRPGFVLRTWPLDHSRFAPVLGVRLEVEGKVLAFTTDTTRCENIVELARGADLLVHDSFDAATVAPANAECTPYHCRARDAGEYARAAGVGSLALVHVAAAYAGRHPALVAEAKTAFAGHVFAPVAGQVFCL
jgi:ribonuclease Z